jgi:membrane fusion protein (multidrug efflux system)
MPTSTTTSGHRTVLLLAACSLLALAGCGRKESTAPAEGPPPAVQVITVGGEDVSVSQEFVGETRGAQSVEIRAQVSGQLRQIAFKEGSQVKKGDLLFVVDPQPYEAAVNQAKAKYAESRAQYVKAQMDADRYTEIAAKGLVPRKQAEDAVANAAASKAAMAAAQAVVESKQVDLNYTRIKSPIDGLISQTTYSVGSIVGNPGEAPLATVSQLGDVRVRFKVAETDYIRLFKERQAAVARGEDLSAGRMRLVLADGSEYPEKGKIVSVDNAVDPTTGTLTVEAEFPNPSGLLRPGQFAKIRVVTGMERGVMMVPQRAVQEVQGTTSLAVVKTDDTVEFRRVEAGERVGEMRVIRSGLNAGDRVIVEGLLKVRPGVKVAAEPVPSAQPAPAGATGAAPQPAAH